MISDSHESWLRWVPPICMYVRRRPFKFIQPKFVPIPASPIVGYFVPCIEEADSGLDQFEQVLVMTIPNAKYGGFKGEDLRRGDRSLV